MSGDGCPGSDRKNESIETAPSRRLLTNTHANSDGITSKKLSSLEDVYVFVDNNLRAVRYTLYAAGAVGVLILGRSLHVHKKFSKLSDIPVNFITKNIPFRARVKAIDREHFLHVDHLPIITSRWLPFTNSEDLLPVKLAGVQITPVGSKWLADHVLTKVVKITPLSVRDNVLESVIFLEKGIFHRSLCVNKSIIEQGLCKVDYPDLLPTSQLHVKLLDSLVAFETKADHKGKGLWGKKVSSTEKTASDGHRWSLNKFWKWLSGKFVKRKT